MKAGISAIQWMAFMIASSIVAPIAIAHLFQFDVQETAGLVQRTVFILGISGLLQGLFGHRMPINEGPAGLWWGVFAIYAGLGTTLFTSINETLQALQGALIVSGIVFILLTALKLIDKLAYLFTPVVSGVYLILLVLQLSGSFIKGMLGVGYRQQGVDLPIALFCTMLVILTYYLTKHKVRAISQFSILISLTVGWLAFSLLGLSKPLSIQNEKWIELPKFLAFGPPIFDTGMIVTAVFTTLLLLTNMVASIKVVGAVLEQNGEKIDNQSFGRAGFIAGINQILGGGFSAVGSVAISGAAGFISTTKITKIKPFIIGCIFIVAASFFPDLMSFFASLPTPIGYSVTFVVFANMVGIAFSELDKEKDLARIRVVIGFSLLTGVGAMFVDPSVFKGISPIITSFLNNGLILGSITAIIIDQISKRVYKKA